MEREKARTNELAIAEAAASLADLYSTDPELTAFQALGSEEFL